MSEGSKTSLQRIPETQTLKLDDGHHITYTVVGDAKNQLLLFVVGSSGLGWLYQRLATELAPTFRCVYYDKRGFLPSSANHDLAKKRKNSLVLTEGHSDDAAALIRHLSPNQTSYVFGTSTGGTAVLDLTIRYPELVHTAILHEPITFSVMRDNHLREEMVELYTKMGDSQDPAEAFTMFAKYMFNLSPAHDTSSNSTNARNPFDFITSPTAKRTPIDVYNSRQGLQEAIAMVKYAVDEQKARSIAEKVVVICGSESIDLPVTKPGEALAAVLGNEKPIFKLPGDHMSFAGKSRAAKFCEELLSILHKEGRISDSYQRRQARM